MNDPGPYYRPEGMPPPRRRRWPLLIGLLFIVAAAVILLFVFLALYPGTFGLGSSPYPSRYGLFGGFFLFFFILIVAFFILRVAFWSTRASGYGRGYRGRYGNSNDGPGLNRPLAVARMRYARGEITREQYDQIVKDLGRGPGRP